MTPDDLVLVRRDSGGVFPDGTTNHPAIDFAAEPPTLSPAAPRPEGLDELATWLRAKREVASEATATYGEHAVGFYDALGIVLAEVQRLSDTGDTPDA